MHTEFPKNGAGTVPRRRVLWTLLALGFLLTYTTWVWAGLRPSFHRVGVGAAGILLIAVALEGRAPAVRAVLRDPVFYLGLAFLGYLAIQWHNAGRVQYFDVGYQRWMYTDPPWPRWPSAFARAEAAQMLTWFFPAWAIAIAIRSPLLDRRALRGLLTFVVGSAALLAAFGLVQFASGTRAIYWRQPLDGHFFASFGYGNHAGPYFVLAGSIGLGLLFREIFDVRRQPADQPSVLQLRHPGRVAVLVPATVLCAVGANMGFSRAGVILNALLGAFATAYLWRRAWPSMSGAGRLNLAALTLGVLGCLYFLVAGFGEQGIRKEFRLQPVEPENVSSTWDRVDLELGRRPQFARAAWAIWREHPWFGVGGWGYRYLVASHVPEKYWPVLETRGWANVHVDGLQYLAEFGLVGMGLLLAALGAMARDAYALRCHRHEAFCAMGAAGLALTVIFSFVDIPFRCPAILYTWVVLLAALPFLGHVRPAGNTVAAFRSPAEPATRKER
jgi:hypothetical protein